MMGSSHATTSKKKVHTELAKKYPVTQFIEEQTKMREGRGRKTG
jgi:hypothetical protein